MTDENTLRRVRLETGHVLHTWDTGTMRSGRTRIGYELRDPAGNVLFSGTNYYCCASEAGDSDDALRGLLVFLTLRPGDTDREYFADYSPAQLEFTESAECEHLQFLYSDEGPGAFVEIDDATAPAS